MVDEDRRYSKQIIGKTIVTKSGRRFGEVSNITFEARTGELIQLVLKHPTSYAEGLELERDKDGSFLIPFSAVIAIGDYVVVSEEDII